MTNGVLLLGGTGFLGTALAARLAVGGRNIHVVSRSAPAGEIGAVRYHRASLDDSKLIARLMTECSTVVHLASATTPGSSGRRPLYELDLNLAPTLRLLDLMTSIHPSRLIFVSSGGTLYGNPERLPADEKSILRPLSYHGAGKMALEAFLAAYAHESGVPVAVLRPSNLYGPGQTLRHGFGVVRTMLEHARTGSAFEIWGDGETVRDFLYIDDMVEVCARAISADRMEGTFNVGSGVGYSLNQLAGIVERQCGRPLEVIRRAPRRTDVRAIVLDISNIRSRLSWKPAISLEEGVRRTWEWLMGS
jgi:UDP-glucose 4-epimerase